MYIQLFRSRGSRSVAAQAEGNARVDILLGAAGDRHPDEDRRQGAVDRRHSVSTCCSKEHVAAVKIALQGQARILTITDITRGHMHASSLEVMVAESSMSCLLFFAGGQEGGSGEAAVAGQVV